MMKWIKIVEKYLGDLFLNCVQDICQPRHINLKRNILEKENIKDIGMQMTNVLKFLGWENDTRFIITDSEGEEYKYVTKFTVQANIAASEFLKIVHDNDIVAFDEWLVILGNK